MKIKSLLFIIASLAVISSCQDLTLNPLSEASSETWYTTDEEFEMAINDFFRKNFWLPDDISWTDDHTRRTDLNPINSGTIDGEWGYLSEAWTLKYKSISRANRVLQGLQENDIDLTQSTYNKFAGNAYFARAAHYSYLINHWGDVIYYTGPLGLDEAYSLTRTEKEVVLDSVYATFDKAIEMLPESYEGKAYATKGAALAMKARAALYQKDWTVVRDAARAVMDLGIYELYPDYGELFRSTTKNPREMIFSIAVSGEYDSYAYWPHVGAIGYFAEILTRNAGGDARHNPSWLLFSAYLCTDGLPIDESPLYNPRKPFENRDPRLSETIVPFGEPHLGFIYEPHPDSTEVLNVTNGNYVTNQDTRTVIQWASFNGLVWKKGIDEDWKDLRPENDLIIMRYADVLLMYAEAKIELNEIDQSVLDAINKVRSRAYGVNYTETKAYPEVSTTNQEELRNILRVERRMEMAFEGRRYMDIIRWGLAEKVLNLGNYGMLNPDQLEEKVISKDLWFFPDIPEIDEDGIANFEPMYNDGLIRRLTQRNFDASKQYLWPIPTTDIQINDNIEQNPNY